MKKALVIGSEGNIGKPLVKYLKNHNYTVFETDIKQAWRKNYFVADINNPLDLLPSFLDFKPDVVFLLSAMVSRVTCEQAASLAVSTNLSGINNIIQLCKRTNSKLVFFSTSEVYGPNCEIMEESIPNPMPNNRYGLTKLLGEKIVEYEVENFGLKAVTLRPFMMYEEEEDLGDHRSAMIRFAFNLAQGKPIEVHKGSTRSWFHASDAVRAIEAATKLDKYFVINIGHPDVIKTEVLAEKIRKLLNAPNHLIKYIDQPSQMTLKKVPVLKRQEEILKIKPIISVDEGIERVCKRIIERINTKTLNLQ